MSDLASLLKELEQVAKDTNLKEVKNKPLEESVASKDDVSSLFEGLEAAYTETRIEEEIANRFAWIVPTSIFKIDKIQFATVGKNSIVKTKIRGR